MKNLNKVIQKNRIKTGRAAAIAGGILALILGYISFTIGLDFATYGEFSPESYPAELRQQAESQALQGGKTLLILPGIACMAGGLLAIAGAAIVIKRPHISGKLMSIGSVLSVFSIIGIIAAIILFIGGRQANNLSTLTPEERSRSVEDDDEESPY